MSAPILKPVNSELVAVAWAQSVPGIPANRVARTLGREHESWAETGFVVATIVGGSPWQTTPVSAPVIQFECWACNSESVSTPPWGIAFILAETLKRACEVDSADRSKVLTIPHGFEQALVRDASALTEPRRSPVPSPEGFARVIMDVQIEWTRYNPEEYPA
jgi:hypothetical protein